MEDVERICTIDFLESEKPEHGRTPYGPGVEGVEQVFARHAMLHFEVELATRFLDTRPSREAKISADRWVQLGSI